MSKGLKYIVLIFLLYGCHHNLIKYSYNGVTVTRESSGATTYLYYGDYKDNNLPSDRIKITYNGFDSALFAYLIFKADSTVEVRRGNGYYTSNIDNNKLFFKDIDNVSYNNWSEQISGKFENVIFISDVIKEEVIINTSNNTKVKYTYPDSVDLK